MSTGVSFELHNSRALCVDCILLFLRPTTLGGDDFELGKVLGPKVSTPHAYLSTSNWQCIYIYIYMIYLHLFLDTILAHRHTPTEGRTPEPVGKWFATLCLEFHLWWAASSSFRPSVRQAKLSGELDKICEDGIRFGGYSCQTARLGFHPVLDKPPFVGARGNHHVKPLPDTYRKSFL